MKLNFCDGSYGYRPKRSTHAAVNRVSEAIINGKTKVIDVDLEAYFDNVEHQILLKKVAQRVDDDKVMRLLKLILKANSKRGIAQGLSHFTATCKYLPKRGRQDA